LLAVAKREGEAKIPAVTRGSLGKVREKGRERTPEYRVWPVRHGT